MQDSEKRKNNKNSSHIREISHKNPKVLKGAPTFNVYATNASQKEM